MDNPAGYIVNRLREGDEPPGEFLELAQLTPDEVAKLEEAWVGSEQTEGLAQSGRRRQTAADRSPVGNDPRCEAKVSRLTRQGSFRQMMRLPRW